jgi:hypothetical protein
MAIYEQPIQVVLPALPMLQDALVLSTFSCCLLICCKIQMSYRCNHGMHNLAHKHLLYGYLHNRQKSACGSLGCWKVAKLHMHVSDTRFVTLQQRCARAICILTAYQNIGRTIAQQTMRQ